MGLAYLLLKYPFLHLNRYLFVVYKPFWCFPDIKDGFIIPKNKRNFSVLRNLTGFLFGFVRIDEGSLGEASPVLARLFLQSIFISVDIRIREGHLFCDTLCANGPLYNGQVSCN